MKIFLLIASTLFLTCCADSSSNESIEKKNVNLGDKMEIKYNELTPEEERIIINKGTEKPFTGKYNDHAVEGFYTCKRCDALLYHSKHKFNSKCGWPSFDDEVMNAIKRIPDADGRRTEIVCSNCDGHLGHVFKGEKLTDKNIRHCVNSVSMNFLAKKDVKIGRAIFAGGCFWGVEYYLQQHSGVLATSVGYIGGTTSNPTYKEVCSKTTGHVEAVEVLFDPVRTNFEILAKLFFEIHDPTQVDRQGPDKGEQYRSVIYYIGDEQKKSAEKLVGILEKQGLKIATKLEKATTFWPGEKYHQDYYIKKGTLPYCHGYTKRFPRNP
jgi:peptide methionine sulfoxide reductase msrA/msrB